MQEPSFGENWSCGETPCLSWGSIHSHEPNEPPHIHVDREGFSAKFWVKEVSLASNLGFRPKELNTLHALVTQHQKQFLDKWYGYFGT